MRCRVRLLCSASHVGQRWCDALAGPCACATLNRPAALEGLVSADLGLLFLLAPLIVTALTATSGPHVSTQHILQQEGLSDCPFHSCPKAALGAAEMAQHIMDVHRIPLLGSQRKQAAAEHVVADDLSNLPGSPVGCGCRPLHKSRRQQPGRRGRRGRHMSSVSEAAQARPRHPDVH